MDPNVCLEQILELAKLIEESVQHERETPYGVAAKLAEQVLALDGWLRGGGFAPSRWTGRERVRG